ncbi:MAG: glycosyltransferase family 4 protein, partial [Candidatus Thermoplasmatota archaeon]|nr:glycosyltransferase family 4 protein [Candidatus Thermoplasmatota archaeon]
APKKGFDFLIRSLALVAPAVRPRLVLVCNGVDPGWREYLEQLAASLGVLLEIRVLVGDEELVSFYNRAALVLFAPYLEPFGLVPLEAMACGTPVVAVREGGVKESVVDGETGILTERDERKFSEAASALLADKERCGAMGRRAIEVVRGFWTIEHAGQRLSDHLERAKEYLS